MSFMLEGYADSEIEAAKARIAACDVASEELMATIHLLNERMKQHRRNRWNASVALATAELLARIYGDTPFDPAVVGEPIKIDVVDKYIDLVSMVRALTAHGSPTIRLASVQCSCQEARCKSTFTVPYQRVVVLSDGREDDAPPRCDRDHVQDHDWLTSYACFDE